MAYHCNACFDYAATVYTEDMKSVPKHHCFLSEGHAFCHENVAVVLSATLADFSMMTFKYFVQHALVYHYPVKKRSHNNNLQSVLEKV